MEPKEKNVLFATEEQLTKINEISRKILRQVFSRLDSFKQDYFFDFEEDDTYYSPSDLVIELSPDDYCYLERFF